jgi:uncharacterized protein YuzB (UPF0349 family)
MTTIEYCLNNVGKELRGRLIDVDCTVEHRCLQRCGECYREDFFVVDGVLETGESHAELLPTTEVTDR